MNSVGQTTSKRSNYWPLVTMFVAATVAGYWMNHFSRAPLPALAGTVTYAAGFLFIVLIPVLATYVLTRAITKYRSTSLSSILAKVLLPVSVLYALLIFGNYYNSRHPPSGEAHSSASMARPASDESGAVALSQPARGMTHAMLTNESLKALEDSVVREFVATMRRYENENYGQPTGMTEPVHTSELIYASGGYYPLVSIESRGAQVISLFGIVGSEFRTVRCFSNGKVKFHEGLCAEKIRESFGIEFAPEFSTP